MKNKMFRRKHLCQILVNVLKEMGNSNILNRFIYEKKPPHKGRKKKRVIIGRYYHSLRVEVICKDCTFLCKYVPEAIMEIETNVLQVLVNVVKECAFTVCCRRNNRETPGCGIQLLNAQNCQRPIPTFNYTCSYKCSHLRGTV